MKRVILLNETEWEQIEQVHTCLRRAWRNPRKATTEVTIAMTILDALMEGRQA